MKHSANPRFWRCYRQLPPEIRKLADEKFSLLKANPRHPSLRLKKVGALWACRVGLYYRALGADGPKGIVWFWIGSHAEYDQLLS